MCGKNHATEAQAISPHLEAIADSLAEIHDICGGFKLTCESAQADYCELGADILDNLIRFETKIAVLIENTKRAKQGEAPLTDDETGTFLHTFFPPDVSQRAVRLLLPDISTESPIFH